MLAPFEQGGHAKGILDIFPVRPAIAIFLLVIEGQ